MKSLAELQAIREKTKAGMGIREDQNDGIRIVVGMATCGIAAGARPVLSKFMEEVTNEKLTGVVVGQTGCIGVCMYEPVVEVILADKTKITYVNMTPEKAVKVVHSHIMGGNVVTEYTIGAAQK